MRPYLPLYSQSPCNRGASESQTTIDNRRPTRPNPAKAGVAATVEAVPAMALAAAGAQPVGAGTVLAAALALAGVRPVWAANASALTAASGRRGWRRRPGIRLETDRGGWRRRRQWQRRRPRRWCRWQQGRQLRLGRLRSGRRTRGFLGSEADFANDMSWLGDDGGCTTSPETPHQESFW